MKKLHLIVGAAAALVAAACSDSIAPVKTVARGPSRTSDPLLPFPGSIWTAVFDGGACSVVDANIYSSKDAVGLNGGPRNNGGSALPPGTYWVRVTAPDGTELGRSTSADVTVDINGKFADCYQLSAIVNSASSLFATAGYDDTPNHGGEYKVWLNANPVASTEPLTFDWTNSKTDNFKVHDDQCTENCGGGEAKVPSVEKDATATYKTTYVWTLSKSSDKTLVEQVGGSVKFTYTVTVSHDAGTNSDVQVTGKITVMNTNVDGALNTVAVTGVTVTDQLQKQSDHSAFKTCTVTNGTNVSLLTTTTKLDYNCSLTEVPSVDLENYVKIEWPEQTLANGTHLSAGSADFTKTFSFTATLIDNVATVTDTYAGSLGTSTVGVDANPKSFTYDRTVPVPANGCQSYDNTATFTVNTTNATDSKSKTVTVCGPTKSGALTIGFWQNKNGQGIISGGAATAGVCNSATWLRTYAPFQDITAGATCKQVAAYVANVIAVATCTSSDKTCNFMLKAQMLATALDVYFSDPALGGNKIGAFNGGVNVKVGDITIDLTKVCAPIVAGSPPSCGGYVNVSSAFGSSSPYPTSMKVSDMLTTAAGFSNAGGAIWYGQIKATQVLAKDAFDAINNQVAFAAP